MPSAPPLTVRAFLDAPILAARAHFEVLLPWFLGIEAISVIPGVAQSIYFAVSPMTIEAGTFPLANLAVVYGVAGIAWLVRLACVLALYRVAREVLDGRMPQGDVIVAAALRPSFYGMVLAKWVVIGLGFMFCMLPGAVLAIFLALLLPVMVAEETVGGRAMNRAYDLLSQGRSWAWGSPLLLPVIAAGVIYWILTTVLTLASSSPAMIWSWIAIFQGASSGMPVGSVVPTAPIWVTLLSIVLGVFSRGVGDLYLVLAFTLLYREARNLREGTDLDDALSRMG